MASPVDIQIESPIGTNQMVGGNIWCGITAMFSTGDVVSRIYSWRTADGKSGLMAPSGNIPEFSACWFAFEARHTASGAIASSSNPRVSGSHATTAPAASTPAALMIASAI